MAVANIACEIDSVDIAEDTRTSEGMAAFDYTCRYYLNMSGADFLARYDRGEFRQQANNTGLMRVLAMLPFVR
jgi:hypothetical protein